MLLGCIGGSELWIPLDTCDLEYLDWICSGHVYNDDEKGTKLVMTRVRPSFVQRLLWSNAASDDLVVQASDPQIPQQESEPCTSIASNAPWRAQFFWWSRNQNIFSSLNVFGSIVSWSRLCVLSLPASSGTLRPSLQDLLTALDAGKLASEGKPVAEALASYKAKVRLRTAVGFFRFFALWVFWP